MWMGFVLWIAAMWEEGEGEETAHVSEGDVACKFSIKVKIEFYNFTAFTAAKYVKTMNGIGVTFQVFPLLLEKVK